VDPSQPIRGGIPVLFPIAGRLHEDCYITGGATYPMKRHGFARELPWTVLAQHTDGDARITLALTSNATTRAMFPWDFEVRLTYVLANDTLTIEQAYTNANDMLMPLHVGFHPYFHVADTAKARTRIETDATRAFDNLTGQVVPFTGFDLTRAEVDLHLLDPRTRTTRLITGDGATVRLEMDETFTAVVVWTRAGQDFVCVEPWSAPADALNTGEGLIKIPPGRMHRARFSITLE
jgi:galactose mutarotase-like enzyme